MHSLFAIYLKQQFLNVQETDVFILNIAWHSWLLVVCFDPESNGNIISALKVLPASKKKYFVIRLYCSTSIWIEILDKFSVPPIFHGTDRMWSINLIIKTFSYIFFHKTYLLTSNVKCCIITSKLWLAEQALKMWERSKWVCCLCHNMMSCVC